MQWRVAASLLMAIGLAASPAAAPPTLTVTHRARALKPGEIVVLTIASSASLSSLEVKAFDRVQRTQPQIRIGSRRTWVALVGIDLDTEPATYEVSISAASPTGDVSTKYKLIVTEKAFATRTLDVDPDFVNPPATLATRIARETAAVSAAFSSTAGPNPARLVFARPVPHRANSVFGTRSIFNGEPRNSHSGADFLSPSGTSVKSPAEGKVVLADNLYFSGGSVIVDHGMGVVSLFAHLSRILAKPGDNVKLGTELGLVGATGRVTGAHLHWAVRVNGARVDPLALLTLLKR
jgi:murein DD-endopeptidase MepM/ murein hydrolase activator NlpD